MALDKKQQNTLAGGAMGLLLAFGFYFFHVKKVNTQAQAYEDEIVRITDIQDKLKQELARYGGDLPRQLALYNQQAKRLEEMIPSREAVPELLNAIAREAQNANVAYGGITPDVSEPAQYYSREMYKVQVSGGYHEIGQYMAGIASLDRIVKPMDLILTVNAQAKPRPDGVPTLDARFRIETYVIPSQAELAADSLKKKKGP